MLNEVNNAFRSLPQKVHDAIYAATAACVQSTQVSPACVEQPPLLPGGVCGSVSRRRTSTGGWDVGRNKPDPSEDHTLGAFVKIVFKIPKGASMVAALSRENKV